MALRHGMQGQSLDTPAIDRHLQSTVSISRYLSRNNNDVVTFRRTIQKHVSILQT